MIARHGCRLAAHGQGGKDSNQEFKTGMQNSYLNALFKYAVFSEIFGFVHGHFAFGFLFD